MPLSAKKKKWFRRTMYTLSITFILVNLIAVFHSYKFTHFTTAAVQKTGNPDKLSAVQKIKILILGVDNPRPVNRENPSGNYETIYLSNNKKIECWSIKTENHKGTVVLFHGFGGNKSSMLDKEVIFRQAGYNTLLVDFMGSGGSEGNQTTIGYKEAEQVKTCYDYLTGQGEQHIYLFGTSMGAVAIMKAIRDHDIKPKGIILECPFGSMYETVSARFRSMHVPSFPMASMLVFWGGAQNGFWAFGHNPVLYARQINCPTLLLYGAMDEKVSRNEIDGIYNNLGGPKSLKIYPQAGHENYLLQYEQEWTQDVRAFLNTVKQYTTP